MPDISNSIAQLLSVNAAVKSSAPAKPEPVVTSTGNSGAGSFKAALKTASTGQKLPNREINADQKVVYEDDNSNSDQPTDLSKLSSVLGGLINKDLNNPGGLTSNNTVKTPNIEVASATSGQLQTQQQLLEILNSQAAQIPTVPDLNQDSINSAQQIEKPGQIIVAALDLPASLDSKDASKAADVKDPGNKEALNLTVGLAQINPLLNIATNTVASDTNNIFVDKNNGTVNADASASAPITDLLKVNIPANQVVNQNANVQIADNAAVDGKQIAPSAPLVSSNAKIIPENKTPDFSNLSNQVFVVKKNIPDNSALDAKPNVVKEVSSKDDIKDIKDLKDVKDLNKDLNGDSDPVLKDANNNSGIEGAKNNPVEKTIADNKLPNVVKYQSPAEQVAFQVAAAVKDGDSKIRIQLEPADLGKVDVQMSMTKEGKLSLTILADRNDTLDMLKSDIKSLEKTLNDVGFKSDATNLSFNLRDGNEGWKWQQQNGQNQNQNTANQNEEIEPQVVAYKPMTGIYTSNQALDIRV